MGRRIDPAAPHQIRLRLKAGKHRVWVGCSCRAPMVASRDGVEDQWAIFNALTHDTARGPFTPATGVPFPAPAHAAHGAGGERA